MAFTYGFYNSKNKDRRYNADQMSQLFDGILNDGVFNKVGELMMVVPGTGLQVLVKSGRAWFNSTWSYNDAAYPLNLSTPDVAVPRIDAVVLEVDHTETVRRNRLLVVKGLASSNPEKPTLTNTDLIHQHPLAYVTLQPGAQSISAGDIEIMVGKDECPFVTGILQTASLEDLYEDWDNQFTTWFDDIKSQLDGDVATNLLNQINQRVKISDLATQEDAETGSDNSKWMSPLRTFQAIAKHPDVGKVKIEESFLNMETFLEMPVADKYAADLLALQVSPNKEYVAFLRNGMLHLCSTKGFKTIETHSATSYNNSNARLYISNSHIFLYNNSSNNPIFSTFSYNGEGLTNIVTNAPFPETGDSSTSYTFATTITESVFSVYDLNDVYMLGEYTKGNNKTIKIIGISLSSGAVIKNYDYDTVNTGSNNVTFKTPFPSLDGTFLYLFKNQSLSYQPSSWRYTIYRVMVSGAIRTWELYDKSESTTAFYQGGFLLNDKIYAWVQKGSTYSFERHSIEGALESSSTMSSSQKPNSWTVAELDGKVYETVTDLREINLNTGRPKAKVNRVNVYKKNNTSVVETTNGQYVIGFYTDPILSSVWRKINDVYVCPDAVYVSRQQKIFMGSEEVCITS